MRIFLLAVLMLAALVPGATAQVAKLYPVDEAVQDSSLMLFRLRLIEGHLTSVPHGLPLESNARTAPGPGPRVSRGARNQALGAQLRAPGTTSGPGRRIRPPGAWPFRNDSGTARGIQAAAHRIRGHA